MAQSVSGVSRLSKPLREVSSLLNELPLKNYFERKKLSEEEAKVLMDYHAYCEGVYDYLKKFIEELEANLPKTITEALKIEDKSRQTQEAFLKRILAGEKLKPLSDKLKKDYQNLSLQLSPDKRANIRVAFKEEYMTKLNSVKNEKEQYEKGDPRQQKPSDYYKDMLPKEKKADEPEYYLYLLWELRLKPEVIQARKNLCVANKYAHESVKKDFELCYVLRGREEAIRRGEEQQQEIEELRRQLEAQKKGGARRFIIFPATTRRRRW